MPYERENIQRTDGYTPGEQPDEMDVVKLNTNENPYPPCDAVMQALRDLPAELLRRYPPPTALAFREVAAKLHRVSADNIIAVNGGDELLRLAVTAFVEPGRPIGMAEPSYSLYPVLGELHDTPVVRVELKGDWSLAADFAKKLNDAGAQATFVVNPHAPSGYLTVADTLAALAGALDGVLVIDEAYVDFVTPELSYDAFSLIERFDNVLILRTLSKGYSLAGLRFGYGVAAMSLIEPLLKAKDSYNTDAVAQALAVAALTHRQDAARTWEAVRSERLRLRRELSGLGLAVVPSESNFLLAGVPDTVPGGAKAVYESLKARRIFVRYFEQGRLVTKLRITVGTPEQNDALIQSLRPLMAPKP